MAWSALCSPFSIQDLLSGLFDGGNEFRRFHHQRAAAPAQDPTLNFTQTGELEPEFDSAVFDFTQLLGGMPAFLANVIRGIGIEADDHVVFALSRVDAKAVAKDSLDGE